VPAAAAADVLYRIDPLPAPLLAGVAMRAGPNGWFNGNVLFDRDGTVLARYVKRRAVPFGEVVPLRRLLGGVGDVGRLVPRDMVAGKAPGRLQVDGRALGTVSSWELSFARDVRAASLGGDAVVTLTNQASYGRSAVSDQLLAMAQLRAAELDKAMLVAAITGQSALIEPDGSLAALTRLYAADQVTATVPLRSGVTPYARLGDRPVVMLALLSLLWLYTLKLQRRAPL
jgi:apolipoprotein N-acyltransferase